MAKVPLKQQLRCNDEGKSMTVGTGAMCSTERQKTKKELLRPGLCQVGLTQALADGHAVLLGVEVVAVARAASVDEAHALPLAHVEVPAGHGGAAGTGFSLQGAHRCRGTAC